jgi:MATE family multidrug resistance protein
MTSAHPPLPTLSEDIRRTLWLALPMIAAQLLQMSAGVVDSLIAGRIGSVELGAVGLGSSLIFVVLLCVIGLSNGLSPVLAKLLGESKSQELGAVFRQGTWLAAISCFIGFLLIFVLIANLELINIDQELIAPTKAYMNAAIWSLLPAMGFMVGRNFFEATENTQPVLFATVIGLIVNIFFSYSLGLGKFGMPAIGVAGIGWATTLSNACIALSFLYLLTRPNNHSYRLFVQWDWPRWSEIKKLLKISIPIAISLLFEVGLFASVTVQMGIFGRIESAANVIALQAASMAFMLPLGLSFILVARVGNALGRQDPAGIKQRLQSGFIIATVMGISTAVALILLRYQIIAFYTDEAEVVRLASIFLILAAIFQISDTSQVTFSGVLRGLQDTTVPMLTNGFSYWVIGFGGGCLLAYPLGMGAVGLWVGLILGLTACSIFLGLRLRYTLKRLHLQ